MSFYSEEHGGLVIKESQYKITMMNLANNEWGNFDEDNELSEKTKVRLTLWEWDTTKNEVVKGTGATFADVTVEEAARLHLGDLLVVRVIVPGGEPE